MFTQAYELIELSTVVLSALLLSYSLMLWFKTKFKPLLYFWLTWVMFFGYNLCVYGIIKISNAKILGEIFILLSGITLSLSISHLLLSRHAIKVDALRFYVLAPFIIVIYRILWLLGYKAPGIGGPTGVAGSLILISGIILINASTEKKERILGALLTVFGFQLILYKVMVIFAYGQFSSFFISSLLFLMLFSFGNVLRSSFVIPQGAQGQFINDLNSIVILKGSELQKYIDMLKELPGLVFTRNPDIYPKQWNINFVSVAVSREFPTISPTNLPKMLDMSVSFLYEAHRTNSRGVVIIDCLEYLCMYNPSESILRFLGTLRDYVILYNGTLIIVLERDAWSEKEFRLIKRVLGVT